jgi:hypothetical protein
LLPSLNHTKPAQRRVAAASRPGSNPSSARRIRKLLYSFASASCASVFSIALI